jgi:DNA polymerase-3 subunit gamma/tau
MAAAEPLAVIETCRQLLERGREPLALLQGLASLLRDLLLAGIAPDRLELTSVSPQLRPELPPVARRIGKNRLLHWQAQLKGSEQQLRHSVQPRLWLEVLLLGLLAEPIGAAAPPGAGASVAAPPPATTGAAARGGSAGAVPLTARETPPVTPREAAQPVTTPAQEDGYAANHPNNPQGPSDETPAPGPQAEQVQTAPEPAPPGENLAEIWQQILAGLELPSTRMLLSQQASLHRLDGRRAVVRVAANWLTMVQSRQSLLEKAMLLALGSARQVTLEASDHPPASPAAAVPALPRVEVLPHQFKSHPHPEADAITAAAASSEPKSPVGTRQKQQPIDPSTSSPQASDPPILGRLETSTRLLADFFQGEVIESSEVDALENSSEIEQLPEAPIEMTRGS